MDDVENGVLVGVLKDGADLQQPRSDKGRVSASMLKWITFNTACWLAYSKMEPICRQGSNKHARSQVRGDSRAKSVGTWKCWLATSKMGSIRR